MIRNRTILSEQQKGEGLTTGFDYLRLGLSVAVLVWHSILLTAGPAAYSGLWSGPFRCIPAAILPMFFALSGFLVTGSLMRTSIPHFLALRALRLVPALAVEVTLSALILGVAFTTMPLREYFTSPEFFRYFGNILGLVHFTLPGVFAQNTVPRVINSQLWTIPFELECYAAIVFVSLALGSGRRRLFVMLLVLFSAAVSAGALFAHSVEPAGPPQGRALVTAFLAGVGLYLYRRELPYSHALGAAAMLISFIFLELPGGLYIAAFPIAYQTVWLGLMRPPRVPFGDWSYGVYLFHFPIEQTIAHIFPGLGHWWAMALAASVPTAACAGLSWTLIERPILRRKAQILAVADRACEVARDWIRAGRRRAHPAIAAARAATHRG